MAAFAMPGPARLAALGWLGPSASPLVLVLLAAVAFIIFVGGALLIWKTLTRHWPPREAIVVLVIVVAARLALDVVRMMGLWIL